MVKVFKDSDFVKSVITSKDKSKLCDFIELCYNPNSELGQINDLEERMKSAFKSIGMKPDKDIMDLKNPEFLGMVVHYLSYYLSESGLSLLIANKHLYRSLLHDMMDPNKDGEDKLKISEKMDALLVRIKTQFNAIYYPERNGEKISEAAEQEVIRLTKPEMRVQKKAV